MTAGTHGTTFGGNPLAMAVGNAVLDVILEPGFLDHVTRMAALLRDRLNRIAAAHPSVIAAVRGQGLMLGLVCAVPSAELIGELRTAGLLTVPASENVVRLLPPLIIEERHIDEAATLIEEVCAQREEKAA